MRLAAISIMLLCAAGWPSGPLPAAAAGPSRVEVRLDPARALVVPGGKVEVLVTVSDRNGRPAAGMLPVLGATSGKLGKIESVAPGSYRAIYHMPANRHPQVAIVAAKIPGAPPAFAVLRLRAKTVLPVNTNKPNVMVSLTLGNRSYGPLRTDGNGRVDIPVEVSPGQSSAQAVAVDEFGNRTRRNVSIPIPSCRRLLAFSERDWLAADGLDSCFIYVIVVNPDGSPVVQPSLTVRKSGGRLSLLKRLGPGLFRLEYTAPAGLSAKQARLVIIDKHDPKTNRQMFVFELSAGQPEQIALLAEPDRLTADGRAHSTITARVTDHAGNPLARTPPRISCDAGTVTGFENVGDGAYRAIYTAPTYKSGPCNCTATIDRGTQKPLSGKVSLQLLTPRPAVLEAESESYRLIADGSSQATIRLVAKDKVGNLLPGVAIRAHTSIGSLSLVLDDGRGRYHAIYSAPRGKKSKKVRIEFTAGSQPQAPRTHVIIDLRPPPQPVLPLPVISVGLLAGLTTNFGRLTSALFELDGVYRFPFLSDMLYLAIEGGFRFGSQHKPALDGTPVETGVKLTSLQLALIFKPFPRARLVPYVGLGGGAEFVEWSIKPSGLSPEKGHELLPGSRISLGCELGLGGGALFIVLRYGYAFLDAAAKTTQPGAGTGSRIRGNVAGLDAAVGYRLFF